MKIFQYVVFYNPKQDPAKAEESRSEIIVPITTVLEKSEDIVKMKAVRGLDEKWMDKLDEITIAVKSF